MPSDEVSFAAKTVSRCTCSMLYDSWHLKLYEVNCYCLIKALLLYLAVTDTQQPSVRITLLLCSLVAIEQLYPSLLTSSGVTSPSEKLWFHGFTHMRLIICLEMFLVTFLVELHWREGGERERSCAASYFLIIRFPWSVNVTINLKS